MTASFHVEHATRASRIGTAAFAAVFACNLLVIWTRVHEVMVKQRSKFWKTAVRYQLSAQLY